MPEDTTHTQLSRAEPSSQSLSRWVAPAALAIALIAIAVAIWALVRSPGEAVAEPEGPTATAEQPDAARARVCAAFDFVRKAVTMQTNQSLGRDPVAAEAVAANARLATLGGGQYLLTRLDPATPPELADAIRSFANNLQDIGMSQLAELPETDPALPTRQAHAQSTSTRIAEMCQ